MSERMLTNFKDDPRLTELLRRPSLGSLTITMLNALKAAYTAGAKDTRERAAKKRKNHDWITERYAHYKTPESCSGVYRHRRRCLNCKTTVEFPDAE